MKVLNSLFQTKSKKKFPLKELSPDSHMILEMLMTRISQNFAQEEMEQIMEWKH